MTINSKGCLPQSAVFVHTVVEDGGRRAVQDRRDEGRRRDAAAGGGRGHRRVVQCECVVCRNGGRCEVRREE